MKKHDELLDRVDVREILEIGEATLYRWVKSGRFPRHDVGCGDKGDPIRWFRSTVDAWLADRAGAN